MAAEHHLRRPLKPDCGQEAFLTLNQIFNGMMPYMIIVIICMTIMYFWPGMTLWLPNYLYGV